MYICIWLNCGRGLIWGLFLFLGWWSGRFLGFNIWRFRRNGGRSRCASIVAWSLPPSAWFGDPRDPRVRGDGPLRSVACFVSRFCEKNNDTKCEHSPEVGKPLFTIYFFYDLLCIELALELFQYSKQGPKQTLFPPSLVQHGQPDQTQLPWPPTLNLAPTTWLLCFQNLCLGYHPICK